MYLYASEHALMDYHLNTEKTNEAVELTPLPVEETNEICNTESK